MAAMPAPTVSLLLSGVKDLLGIPSTETSFDSQLVMYINSVFETLNQLGFGPATTFKITKTTGSIEDFLPTDEGVREFAMLYVYHKVRLMFDPPTSSFVLASLQSIVNEYEWRLTNYNLPVVPEMSE